MTYRPNHRSAAALIGVLLTVLILVSPLPVVSVDAQAGEQDYTGVDIVFVVDQSGSMGGAEYGSEYVAVGNDPNDLRFSGLQQMVERLAGYRLNYFHDSEVQFQIGVVYFGSDRETIVEPTVVAPNTLEEWQPLSDELQAVLSAEAFHRNLKGTDHLLALQEAKRILQEMKQAWQGGQHLQVIMMLTDGEWTEGAPDYYQDGEFQPWKYSQAMKEYVRIELAYPSYRFFLAAINDRSDEYWSHVEDYWKELTNNQAELMDANTMWALFERILADLTVNEPGLADKKTTRGQVVEIPETQDRIAVPPYLQEITFIIHKPAPEVRVKMYQEGDLLEDLVTATVEGKDRYIESISIRNPNPGYITIERPVSTGILRIFMSHIGADVSCDPISTVAQFVPVRLQCALSGQEGPLSSYSDPRFQLTVQVEIRGESTSQRLELVHQGQSTYTAYYLPTQPGEYAFSIAATTQKPDGTPFELFRKPPTGMASFTVEPTGVRLNVGQFPTTLLSVPVSVVLVDANGATLKVPSESVGFVQMHLTLAMADQHISVDLTPAVTGYQGSFTPFHAGSYQVHLTGLVTDPATGQPFTAFDQGLGSLEVEPLEARLNVDRSLTALLPVPVSVTLVDASGAALAVPPESLGFMQIRLTLTTADQQTFVDLTPGATGYQGSLALYPGSYQIHLEGLVTDPATGQSFTALDESFGSLEVLAPRIVWKGFTSPWPQYHPAQVDFYLTDQSDNPIGDQLGATWHLEAQLEVKSGEQTKAVDLAVK